MNFITEYCFTGAGGDDPVFADGKVVTCGQIIGVVLARDQPLAQRAAKAVKVTYQDLPSVITIEVHVHVHVYIAIYVRKNRV